MRTHNNSRLPNLALIGLLVAVALLAYSYWNVSWKNASLSQDLDENIAELKREKTKRSDLTKRLDAMDQKLKESIIDLDKEKMQSKTIEKEHNTCRAQLSDAQHEFELAKSDASVCQNKMAEDGDTITKLKQEKDVIQANLDKCQADFDSEKSGREGDKQQATADCEKKVDDFRLSLLQQVKASNVDVLLVLKQRGVNVAGISLETPPPIPDAPDHKQVYAGDNDQQPQQPQVQGNNADADVGNNKRRVYQPAASDDRQGRADVYNNKRNDDIDDRQGRADVYNNKRNDDIGAAASDFNNNNNGRQRIDYNNNNNVNDGNSHVDDSNRRPVVDKGRNDQQPQSDSQPVVANPAADQLQNNNNPQQVVDNTRNGVANNNVNNDKLMPNNDQSALNAGAANPQVYRRSGHSNRLINNDQQVQGGQAALGGTPNTPAVPAQPQGNNDVQLEDSNRDVQQPARARFDPPEPAADRHEPDQPVAGAGIVWQQAPLPANSNSGPQQAVVAAPVVGEGAAPPVPVADDPAAPAQPWRPDTDNNGQQQLRMPLAPAGDNGVDRSALGQAAVVAPPLPVNVLPGQEAAAPVGAGAAVAPVSGADLQVAPPAVAAAPQEARDEDEDDEGGIRVGDTNVEAAAGAGVEDNKDADNDRLDAVRKDNLGGAGVEDNAPDGKKDEDDYEEDGNKGQPPAQP